MDAPNQRRPLGKRFRVATLPLTACVFFFASSTSVDKSTYRFIGPPAVDFPLYQKSPDATPLTREERRSCPSAILTATGHDPFYSLTSVADGVRFDIDADGKTEQLSWTRMGSPVAFLATDRNGDNAITSGKELFGVQTLPGVAHGFSALREMNMDTNGGVSRGSVSADDPLMARLLLWWDRNHNGISERSELQALGDTFSDLGLGYSREEGRDEFGNGFLFHGWAHLRTAPGRNPTGSLEEHLQRRRRIYAVCFARSM